MNAAFLQTLQGACVCGQTHTMYTKDILRKSGAIYELGAMLVKHGFPREGGVIICDDNTWAAAGQLVGQVLNSQEHIILPSEGLHADERATETVLAATPKAKYYIAVGSGTIHDITRYCAHQRDIDFVSVPTAASVDGFASTVAAMTLDGMKVTLNARAPRLIVADTDILAEAPYRLTASGVGDIIGKYTALADWKIANLVTGEHICERIVDMQAKNIEAVAGLGGALARGDRAAFEKLIDGLLLSGIYMQLMKNSRPASGVEHHISHLWETHILGNRYEAFHGEKVGVGTAVACGLYKKLLETEDIAPYLRPYPGITEAMLEPVFGVLTPYVMKENTPDCMETVDPARLAAVWPQIREILRGLPTKAEIERLLRGFKAPVTPADVGIDDGLLHRTLANCAYARNRLTLYRMTLMMDVEALKLY